MEGMKYTRLEDQAEVQGDGPAGGFVDAAPLVGTWVNTDKNTQGIVKMILTADGGTLHVKAFGACSPSPCDWGEVRGAVFSGGTTSHTGMAFTTFFDFGFMETLLAVYYKGGILVLDSFNTFKDDSGRANYFSREFFHNCATKHA
jgi:hypothetical protein